MDMYVFYVIHVYTVYSIYTRYIYGILFDIWFMICDKHWINNVINEIILVDDMIHVYLQVQVLQILDSQALRFTAEMHQKDVADICAIAHSRPSSRVWAPLDIDWSLVLIQAKSELPWLWLLMDILKKINLSPLLMAQHIAS